MKKTWKRLLALITATLMLVGMLPAAVMAAPTIDYTKTGSLTIVKHGDDAKSTVKGAGFTLYKIATLTDTGYTMNVTATGYTSADSLANLTSAQQDAAANAFKKVAKTPVGTELITPENGTIEFKNLELGYYLVVETTTPAGYVASVPFFVAIPSADNADDSNDVTEETPATNWVYDVTARPKNKAVSIDKVIVDGDKEKKAIEAGVGSTVNYEIRSKAPVYTADYFTPVAEKDPVYKVTDTLSAGLDLNKDSNGKYVKVTVDGNVLDEKYYTVTVNKNENKTTTLAVDFSSKIKEFNEIYKGQDVVISYSTTINKDAVVGNGGNTNDVELSYSHQPGVNTTAKPGTIPKVYTYGLKITKTGVGSNPLEGAKFKLYSSDGTTQIKDLTDMDTNGIFTSSKDGKIIIKGLASGTYYLEEVEAPKGYTLLTNKIEFTITGNEPADGTIKSVSSNLVIDTAETGYATTTIINKKGFTLPATGGMGTYLFTIGGVILMLGAAIILLTMRKKNRV